MTTDRLPLTGCRVLVTRARAQADELVSLLEVSGADVERFAAIETVAPPSWDSIDAVIDDPDSFDWLVFTSRNGVELFFERMNERGRDAGALGRARIGAVGPATAEALRAHGLEPDAVPEKSRSIEIAALLPADQRGVRTAVVRALHGHDELLDDLRARGGDVHLAVAYETRGARSLPDDIRRKLVVGAISIVTFTSPSTVHNLLRHLDASELQAVRRTVTFVSIGPTTTAALGGFGVEAIVEARDATLPSLRDAVVEAWAMKNRG